MFVGHSLLSQSSLADGIAYLEAGQFAEATKTLRDVLKGEPDNRTASICYGRALGLSGETEQALLIFKELERADSTNAEVQLNLAECHLWNSKPLEALPIYQKLLQREPTNFTALLGMGNALAADKDYRGALDYILKAQQIQPDNSLAEASRVSISTALAYVLYKKGAYSESEDLLGRIIGQYPDHNEAQNILGLISADSKTSVMANYSIQSDNGGNKNVSRTVGFNFRLNGKHKVGIHFGDNDYTISPGIKKAKTQFMSISDKVTLNTKTHLNLNYRIASVRSEEGRYSLSTYSTGLERFWNSSIYSRLQFSRENHDYNIDLLDSRIIMDNYSLSNNVNLFQWLGWYSELVYTEQSDDNARKLLFTSLYFQIGKSPNIKLGYNFNYISFSEANTKYFSPKDFRTNEFFVQITNQESAKYLGYHLQVAIGQQQVEQSAQQITSRVDAKLHWRISKRLLLGGYYLYNNAASATVLGEYTSETVGMNLTVNLN